MTLNVHRRRDLKRALRTRVWLDGVDVTNRCFYADGRRGVVRLYRHNTQGKKFIDPIMNGVATEEKRGHVQWGQLI